MNGELLVGALLGAAVVLLLGTCRRGRRRTTRRPAVAATFRATLRNRDTGDEKEAPMATRVPPGFNLRLELRPVDADGQPANVDLQDRAIAWASSNPEVSVAVDPNQLVAVVSAPNGFRGTAQISADADADLDAAEDRPVIALEDVEWIGGEAVSLGFAGNLEPKA